MLLWHLGATIAFTRYAFRDERMDLRFLMLGAIVADLIDTPIGFLFWDQFHNVRLVAHSLLFGASLMVVVVLATRRGRPRKQWMPVAIGVLMHLFLDAMWQEPNTLWWPFLGWAFTDTGFATASQYLRSILTDWRTWALEAVGLAYLVFLAARSGMSDPTQRRVFLTTGRVAAPIDDR